MNDYVQRPGNKVFICPSCKRLTRVSIRVGYQEYECPTTHQLVTIEDQIEAFKGIGEGKTVALGEYIENNIVLNKVEKSATLFEVLDA